MVRNSDSERYGVKYGTQGSHEHKSDFLYTVNSWKMTRVIKCINDVGIKVDEMRLKDDAELTVMGPIQVVLLNFYSVSV